MRITLAQLLKTNMPYNTSEELDVKDELIGLEDILDSSLANVNYVFNRLDDETYLIKIKACVDLVLQGPVSLTRFTKHLVFESDEIFSKREYNDDCFLIEGMTIDTKEAVVMNILLNKPMRVEDSEFEEEDDANDTLEEYINPAFANLKDLL